MGMVIDIDYVIEDEHLYAVQTLSTGILNYVRLTTVQDFHAFLVKICADDDVDLHELGKSLMEEDD